jgi:uncharacterized protein YbjT (DUF2867 family)
MTNGFQAFAEAGRMTMRIVVIGGTGRIGSWVVRQLREHRHAAMAASPDSGVNTLTGEGLADALRNASVVVDVSNSPSFDDAAALKFFVTSTSNILEAEAAAGVGHHVALSIVGTDRPLFLASGYVRAKMAQETLIRASRIPYSIVRATQFFEFLNGIAAAATDGTTVRVPSALIQPMAAEDVAAAVARAAEGAPLNRIVEIGGPDKIRFDEFMRRGLRARNDPREVVADPRARYFGAELGERTLVAGNDAQLGKTRLDEWLRHLPTTTTTAGQARSGAQRSSGQPNAETTPTA